VPPGGDYRASHGGRDAPLRRNASREGGAERRVWAECGPSARERCGADAGQRYRYLDWGSTGDLDDTAMLAQQARKPMTPAHTAAEPPDVPIRSLGSVFPATLLTNG
jgi:hypothetical protein